MAGPTAYRPAYQRPGPLGTLAVGCWGAVLREGARSVVVTNWFKVLPVALAWGSFRAPLTNDTVAGPPASYFSIGIGNLNCEGSGGDD